MPPKLAKNDPRNRFVGTADDFYSPICNTCKHRHDGTVTCEAFPGGILDTILEGTFDHHNPHPDDGGIQYEKGEAMKTW